MEKPAEKQGLRIPGFAQLQRLGKSLMLPIALLPAAGILLRLGQEDLLGQYDWPVLGPFFDAMSAAGGAIFANLPLLFAVGVATRLAGASFPIDAGKMMKVLIVSGYAPDDPPQPFQCRPRNHRGPGCQRQHQHRLKCMLPPSHFFTLPWYSSPSHSAFSTFSTSLGLM